jgi:hypothetical protein
MWRPLTSRSTALSSSASLPLLIPRSRSIGVQIDHSRFRRRLNRSIRLHRVSTAFVLRARCRDARGSKSARPSAVTTTTSPSSTTSPSRVSPSSSGSLPVHSPPARDHSRTLEALTLRDAAEPVQLRLVSPTAALGWLRDVRWEHDPVRRRHGDPTVSSNPSGLIEIMPASCF